MIMSNKLEFVEEIVYEKAEGICSVIGSLVGAIGTGVAIYFTGSVWCSIIGFLGFMIGDRIGKVIDDSKEE